MPLPVFRDPVADDRLRNTLALYVAHCALEANRITQSDVYSCAWRTILAHRVRHLPLTLDAGEDLEQRLADILRNLRGRVAARDTSAASARGNAFPLGILRNPYRLLHLSGVSIVDLPVLERMSNHEPDLDPNDLLSAVEYFLDERHSYIPRNFFEHNQRSLREWESAMMRLETRGQDYEEALSHRQHVQYTDVIINLVDRMYEEEFLSTGPAEGHDPMAGVDYLFACGIPPDLFRQPWASYAHKLRY